jgi:hypothetical protein
MATSKDALANTANRCPTHHGLPDNPMRLRLMASSFPQNGDLQDNRSNGRFQYAEYEMKF